MEQNTEILIVEDSLTQAEQLRYILEKNNYSVIHAIDAEKALEKLEHKIPELIISDVVMPGIDGYEFCKKVKSDSRFKNIPLILLTSLSDPNNILKGLEYGTDSFITKPYKEEFLLAKIQYLISNFKYRKKHPVGKGKEILFRGKKHLIQSDPMQILDLLFTTYENTLLQNEELNAANKKLSKAQLELKKTNQNLEQIVEDRTRELIKNQHLLLTVTTEAPIVMFSVNKNGIFTLSNGKGLKKLGLNPGQVVGLSIFDVFKEYPGMLTEVRKALTGEEVRSIDIVNGVYFDTLYQPVKDKTGDVVSVVGVAVDVTQQKLSEEKLKEKTLQLEKSNKEKEELITTKNKLMSIISHDLLGNFNPLMGFSEILAKEVAVLSQENISSIAKNLNSAFNKQHQLLTNLLQWGQIQNERSQFNPISLNLSFCVNEITELLNQNLANKNIALSSEIDEKLEVFADKHMVETIIRNLISNATKFSKNGGKIKVAAREKDKYVQVDITDNGVGIDVDNLKKIFLKDEFLSTKGTNNEKGSGLGLILCSEFVEKHGGKIWADSEMGNFTTISFTLPKNIDSE